MFQTDFTQKKDIISYSDYWFQRNVESKKR